MLSGEIANGTKAFDLGLLSHLEGDAEDVQRKAMELARSLADKPPFALQTTKQWLNELDGSFDDELFNAPAIESAKSIGKYTKDVLRTLWGK